MTEEPAGRGLRADAQRNRSAIMNAALACLAANPRASMTEIAKAAGVGRVTLYGHFSSRTELLDATAEQAMLSVEARLGPMDLNGDPLEALDLLVRQSWRLLDGFRGLLAAAEAELDSDQIREHHDQAMLRVRQLIERGQADGMFRNDLSSQWLTASFFSLLHGAAAEIRAGRLGEPEAATALPATITSIVAIPGWTAPRGR
jgi:TetR/AcrR family transcriptional repressor of mexCD-oprJ operon